MRLTTLLLATTLALPLPALAAGPPLPPRAEQALPVGKWSVEFSNGVIEKVEVKKDGTASVTEPNRTSVGKVTPVQGSFLFVCEDGRVERWTPVGRRMVVEHWASVDQMPSGAPVKGIADVTD
jgi:hypothetical protein